MGGMEDLPMYKKYSIAPFRCFELLLFLKTFLELEYELFFVGGGDVFFVFWYFNFEYFENVLESEYQLLGAYFISCLYLLFNVLNFDESFFSFNIFEEIFGI